MKQLAIPACHQARNPMENGPFLADLGLLLWSKREQRDKSESAPLLHTFKQQGSIFSCAKGF